MQTVSLHMSPWSHSSRLTQECDSHYKKCFHSVLTKTSLQQPQLTRSDKFVGENFCAHVLKYFVLSGLDLAEPWVTLALPRFLWLCTESMTTSSTQIQRSSMVSSFNCLNTSIIVCLLALHALLLLSFH